MSKRDDALGALHARLAAALAPRDPVPVVLRNQAEPKRLPAGGLVVVRDGGLLESTAILSPLAWAIEHQADVEVIADGGPLLDALMVAVGAAIAGDRTLGGAVEWAQPGAADTEDVEYEGAASASAALVPVVLHFTAAGSPLA